MIKVIIQIPCYNEEKTLPQTLRDLPRELPGVDVIEYLVIDDGSTDRTVEIAREQGVHHIVRQSHNQGLARAFCAGLEASVRAGADIIVNTDADNQYVGADIHLLVTPIIKGQAEIVIGERPIEANQEWSVLKRKLQRVGSWVVRMASNTMIADAPSGFRAISSEAAIQLNVFGSYTYTLETIIQAGRRGLRIVSVPIRVNPSTRPSRLVKSVASYVYRSTVTIFRIFMVYNPFQFFFWLGTIPFCMGSLLSVRWLILFLIDFSQHASLRSRAPSLIIASFLMLMGIQLWGLGLAANLMAVNRQLLESIQARQRRRDWTGKSD